ncbi:SIR2 family protein [Vineibacter terrae]|uniref:SIR2 family protein n=2 Tax=Vineibacter terrae TaxID=2586908 RepID=A0A5C8PLZ5_9HYPH|nr:SIR2 family protein [Vineibacter terrae]
MVDLRQILSQGRKRVGLLIGAGAPTAVKVDDKGQLKDDGKPLIPDVARLTDAVVNALPAADQGVIAKLKTKPDENPNIEAILTRVRRLAQAIASEKVHGLDATGYTSLAERICQEIGSKVGERLPDGQTPFTELISWIGGTHRDHPVEIFTPNYDLLIEEAFERARLPYFDGFTGAHMPFFDPVSVSGDKLPPRWSRLWKIHGSLGWDVHGDSIIRTGLRTATKLIYPDHLKYDEVTRQPYSSLFEHLRQFLITPDTLLICSGFSFFDAHICAVLDEALAANTHTAIFAFQYQNLDKETLATKFAMNRPNLSVYARDGAVIFGVPGQWQPGQPPTDDWESIRQTFWQAGTSKDPAQFLLGDFAKLARFFSLTQASKMIPAPTPAPTPADPSASGTAPSPPAGGAHAKS